MCFKLNFSNPLEDQEDPLILYVSNLNDEVKKIHITIAEKNTWQGTKMPTAVEFHGVQVKFNKYLCFLFCNQGHPHRGVALLRLL